MKNDKGDDLDDIKCRNVKCRTCLPAGRYKMKNVKGYSVHHADGNIEKLN
jgi:hypothetical protein